MLRHNLSSLLFAILSSTGVSLALNSSGLIPFPSWYISLLVITPIGVLLNLVFTFLNRTENFSQLLLASIVVKMLLALTTIIIYRASDESGFFGFSLHFIAHYILFTVFEIRYLFYIVKIRDHAKNT